MFTTELTEVVFRGAVSLFQSGILYHPSYRRLSLPEAVSSLPGGRRTVLVRWFASLKWLIVIPPSPARLPLLPSQLLWSLTGPVHFTACNNLCIIPNRKGSDLLTFLNT